MVYRLLDPDGLRKEIGEFAATLAAPSGEIYVPHVIDADLVERLAQEEYAETDAAIERLR